MKKKTGIKRTYDTDRYCLRYHLTEDATFVKSIWEEPTYVGPDAYNNSHIDKILESGNNRASDIIGYGYNPFINNRGYQSQETVKFRP